MMGKGARGQRGLGDRRGTHLSRAVAPACILAVTLLYFWGLGSLPLLDPDEGMYAEISREMLASGDWIVPRFNGVVYVEKPPLMYWLTAATYAVAGPTEFSARFWKVASMLGTIALTSGLGCRLFSSRVGALSGMILATTLGAFLFSRITQMDPVFVFAITLAAYGIVSAGTPAESGQRGKTRRGGLWFWVGVGIATMSKGLLGIIFPLVLLGLWILLSRDIQMIRRGWSWPGVLLAALLTLPWHAAAWWKVPGFVQFYLLDNQLLRFLGERVYVEDGKSLGTIPFLGITFFALFPWAPYLMAALTVVWRDIQHGLPSKTSSRLAAASGDAELSAAGGGSVVPRPWDRRVHFLVGWLLTVVGFFSVSSFKLEYYALPAFPAAALLVAALVGRADADRERHAPLKTASVDDPAAVSSRSITALRCWSWVALVGGLLYLTATTWAWWAGFFTPLSIIRGLSLWATSYRVILEQGLPLPSVSPGNYASILIGGGLLWVAGYAAAVFALRQRRVLMAASAVVLIGFGLGGVASSVLQGIGRHHSVKPLAVRLNGMLRPEDVLVHERGLEKGGGLPFYTGHQVLVLNGTQGDLEFGSRFPESRRRFIDTRAFLDLWEGGQRVFLVTDLPFTWSAISRVPGPQPSALASTGVRWLYVNRPSATGSSPTTRTLSADTR